MIGFATGVFDLPHKGHFQFLQAASSRCDRLIIGLTTDERCQQEKRKPIMSFEDRKTILMNSKYVDLVVENRGQSKQAMYDQLKFDVLFTTDEYIEREEFTSFKRSHPMVPVICFPITSGVRTTHHIQQMESEVMSALSVCAVGISGPLLLLDRRDSKMVIKPIHIGITEALAPRTSNCYQMSFPPPRNWRKPGLEKIHPNIAGVNAFREIEIQKLISGKPWNVVIQARQVYENPSPSLPSGHIVEERKFPQQIYWLHQRYAGPTFAEWALQAPHDRIGTVLRSIKKIIDEELIPEGIVHGDLHAHNICVDPNTLQVSLIDFGWCMCRNFIMDYAEREYMQQWIDHQGDWTHFINSLPVDFPRESWIESLH